MCLYLLMVNKICLGSPKKIIRRVNKSLKSNSTSNVPISRLTPSWRFKLKILRKRVSMIIIDSSIKKKESKQIMETLSCWKSK